MYSLLLGMLGFLLFFLYDVNSFTWRSRLLHKSFALGVTLLAAATVLDLAAALRMGAFSGLKDLILLVAGLFAWRLWYIACFCAALCRNVSRYRRTACGM